MEVKAILTNRELKNKVTGIDLYVSDYQEIPYRIKDTYLYHVIVVTNLFYYKLKEHRESDIVQFMVSKTFEEFQNLYEKLYERFPSVNFPPLPSKNILSSSNNVTKARLECMDKTLKLVASTQKLASSPMLISFLKGNPTLTAKKDQPEIEEEEIHTTERSDVLEEATNDVDLFLNESTTKTKEDIFENGNENINKTGGKSIFDEEPYTEADVELFKSNQVKSGYEKMYEIGDENDLLNVSEDFDELLLLSRSSEVHPSIKARRTTSKARTSSELMNYLDKDDEKEDIFKQARTQSTRKSQTDSSTISDIFQKKSSSLFDADDDDDLFTGVIKKDVDAMGEDDITSYILQQQMASDDVSLGL